MAHVALNSCCQVFASIDLEQVLVVVEDALPNCSIGEWYMGSILPARLSGGPGEEMRVLRHMETLVALPAYDVVWVREMTLVEVVHCFAGYLL